jgi:hypothetical protein
VHCHIDAYTYNFPHHTKKEKKHLNLCIIPKCHILKSLKIQLTFNKNESKPRTKKKETTQSCVQNNLHKTKKKLQSKKHIMFSN